MASTIAIIRLLQQLLKRSYRQDKSFDKYQLKFLKKLQTTSSSDDKIELFNECYDQLEALPNTIEDNLQEGRLIVSQSQVQLQRIDSLSDAIKNKIQETQSIPQLYSISEHHNELTELIKIYQRAVIELNKGPTQPVYDNGSDIEIINDELQQLIVELDVGDAYIKRLDHVRLTISSETDAFKLPHHCLKVINIIIDSTREERRSSRHFLYTLNDTLTQFYLNFAQTLKVTETEFNQQQESFSAIEKKALSLKKHTEEARDLATLQKHISEYVSEVQQIVNDKEQQQEKKFRHKFQGMVRQIKELQAETKSYQKTLKQQSKQLHIDFLTKIPNRAGWSERLEIEVTRFQRYQNPLNLAVLDIDKFKSINDTFGHLAGDKVLNVIAQTLQKSIRNTDYIARFGGEEFALLLPDIPQEQALQVLNKLCLRIKKIPFKFKKENVSITISIGFTTYSLSDTADEAFERADSALFKAKKEGRDQVIFVGRTEQESLVG